MTDTAAREKLAKILDDTFTAEQTKIADAFNEPPVKTPSGGWNMSRIFADAILSAFPHLGAPTEDAMKAARKVADKWYSRENYWHESLAKQIAALVTAHAAREREALAARVYDMPRRACQIVDFKSYDDAWESGYDKGLRDAAAAIRARSEEHA